MRVMMIDDAVTEDRCLLESTINRSRRPATQRQLYVYSVKRSSYRSTYCLITRRRYVFIRITLRLRRLGNVFLADDIYWYIRTS